MRQIHKEYKKSFTLEPTKLTRLVAVVHERLADHAHIEVKDRFELFYGHDGREELDRLEDVLAVENSRRRQVQRLVLTSSGTSKGEGRPEHEVFIDFAAIPFAAKPDASDRVVNVAVRSDESGWATRTLSEVEEQLERSWVSPLRADARSARSDDLSSISSPFAFVVRTRKPGLLSRNVAGPRRFGPRRADRKSRTSHHR